ncbi:solute:Na+ symporter, SSS family [Flavobacterium glycines]|uniref:Transporter n=1 Tax=Flavobacterium glycines TaxID=551990 RepID=A0A1B9DGU6_9FLAO|nr:sodium/solute symporter [Flavobacterium glycines]OCB68893.1 sodium transporter [Flavobacterium glycines]GEL11080.1 transporter [Flavobacterium glycines]SDJ29606.1 solute:Na+ symporter, SSS family [Flavobacterium glycines]
MNALQTADYIVFLIYFVIVTSYGMYIYRSKKNAVTSSNDYFLAEGSLTWWAIGASLIASNISAEHFIGMSGSGFALGLAISSYEWMSAATLIIVAMFILPVYLKNKIFTMPQFLAKRYNDTVSAIMAVIWLLIYIFVNLTSIIYLGALAISSIAPVSFEFCVIGLSLFSVIVTLGGMKVIGYTDMFQVIVLILGGLVTTYLALTLLSEQFGFGKDIFKGLSIIADKAPGHLQMIFDKSNPHYTELPGMSVIVGGMLINNLAYWGCNQYIVQRALGADLKTARKGILFAAFLKLLVPVIAVLPGIAMYVMHQNGMFQHEMLDAAGVLKPDRAYPTLMNLLPAGLKGIALAALTAAIVASLAGKANSISTIFSLDIYRKYFDKTTSEKKLVRVGRLAVVVAMFIGAIVAPSLKSLDQAYQFIQEYVGFFSPGVLAIFMLGMFWKKTTANAGLAGALLTVPIATVLKFLPVWTNGAFPDFPFLDRMSITFVMIVAIMIGVSLLRPEPVLEHEKHKIEVDTTMFKVSSEFIIGSFIICSVLVALYTVFW